MLVLTVNKQIAFKNLLMIIKIAFVLLLLYITGSKSVIKFIANFFIGFKGISSGFNLL